MPPMSNFCAFYYKRLKNPLQLYVTCLCWENVNFMHICLNHGIIIHKFGKEILDYAALKCPCLNPAIINTHKMFSNDVWHAYVLKMLILGNIWPTSAWFMATNHVISTSNKQFLCLVLYKTQTMLAYVKKMQI